MRGNQGDANQGAAAGKLDQRPGSSFVRGATWVFDDDDTKENAESSENAGDLSSFDAFAAEFANAGITGEENSGNVPKSPQ